MIPTVLLLLAVKILAVHPLQPFADGCDPNVTNPEYVIRALQQAAQNNNLDPYQIQSTISPLAIKFRFLLTSHDGTLHLSNGWALSISTLRLASEADIRCEGNLLTINLPLTFDDIETSFEYKLNAGLWNPEGRLTTITSGLKVGLILVVDINTGLLDLQVLTLDDPGSVEISFTSMGVIEGAVTEPILDAYVKIVKPVIFEEIVEKVKGIIQETPPLFSTTTTPEPTTTTPEPTTTTPEPTTTTPEPTTTTPEPTTTTPEPTTTTPEPTPTTPEATTTTPEPTPTTPEATTTTPETTPTTSEATTTTPEPTPPELTPTTPEATTKTPAPTTPTPEPTPTTPEATTKTPAPTTPTPEPTPTTPEATTKTPAPTTPTTEPTPPELTPTTPEATTKTPAPTTPTTEPSPPELTPTTPEATTKTPAPTTPTPTLILLLQRLLKLQH